MLVEGGKGDGGGEAGFGGGCVRGGRRCDGQREREEAYDADAGNGVFTLGGFSEHDVCFVLGEVDLGGFGCLVCHVGAGVEMARLIIIVEAWLGMVASMRLGDGSCVGR